MFATFIPDYLRDFFGDVYSPDRILFTSIDEHWEWGVRHYWYFCMMVILFLLALVNVGLSIYKLLNKNYNFSSGNGLCS